MTIYSQCWSDWALICIFIYVYLPWFCQVQLLALLWRHNGHGSLSNHQPRDCLFNRLFRRRSKKTSKLRVTGPCAGNSPVTDEFPTQMASYAENVSIWWRHHGMRPSASCTVMIALRCPTAYRYFTCCHFLPNQQLATYIIDRVEL